MSTTRVPVVVDVVVSEIPSVSVVVGGLVTFRSGKMTRELQKSARQINISMIPTSALKLMMMLTCITATAVYMRLCFMLLQYT